MTYDYDFEGKRLDVSGASMHYLDEGDPDAPPVVMVHGNPTWSYYYRGLVRALRGTHRCIVPDHIGCGRSDKPSAEQYRYVLDQRVADLDALIEHTQPKGKINLVVHDWGGMIGFTWAVRNPERVDKIVVLNTSAFPLPESSAFPKEVALARAPGVGALLVRGFNAFSKGAVRRCVVKPMSAGVAAGYLEPYGSWADRVAVHEFVRDVPLGEGDRSWKTIKDTADGLTKLADVPLMVCWGMQDFVFNPHFLAE